MNNDEPHLYSYATQPAHDWTPSFFTSALGLLLLILFYNTIIPLFISPSQRRPFKLNRLLIEPFQMAARVTTSLLTLPKRTTPLPQHLSGSNSTPPTPTNPQETKATSNSISNPLPKV